MPWHKNAGYGAEFFCDDGEFFLQLQNLQNLQNALQKYIPRRFQKPELF